MSGNVFTMETKQEIYSSWVQYTTKNEESHFRHFIRGFVAIWETQLKLDWDNSENLPNWESVKDDFGPHLSRLPEELLPAIGKFIFIAKDNAEKGSLDAAGIVEMDLLVRCLTAISRNFDNIPLIASCDFVGQAVAIASVIVHQLEAGDCSHKTEGVQYCTDLCHFLECLYDPYLSWRHFQLKPPPDPDKLVFHPALLHNEVIPFIYECFETPAVTEYPRIGEELLNVLGSIVCGAQNTLINESEVSDGKTDNERHNALRGICPATVNLLMNIVSNPGAERRVQTVALKCFCAMVVVLHRSLPHERQIEVTTVLEILKEVISSALKSEWSAEMVSALLQLIATLQNILTASNISPGLQKHMVDAKLLDALLNILEQSVNTEENKLELTLSSVKAINMLVVGSNEGKKRMKNICGYSRLLASLHSMGSPSKQLLESLIYSITEEDSICLKDLKLVNTEPLVPFIRWLGDLPADDQLWLACTLEGVCTNSLQSKAVACKSGVVAALCELLSSASLDSRAANHIILTVESLASYSVSANELKQCFLLLRTDQEKKNPHRNLLLSAISNITRKAGLQLHCDSYFDIEQETDGITISDMRKWNGAVYGFSFHCWLRLEPINEPSSEKPLHRRQIFNLVTSQGTGMEGFISSEGALVVGVTTKKEFLAATVPDFSLLDTQWHCLDLCYTAARRPFGHNQLSVFIDGHQKLAAAMKFPAMTEPFTVCTVGAAATRNYQANQQKSEKSPSGIMERGILPSFMSQVPNYFSLPLRSTTPLDPHVKNFPPNMQDTIFGAPFSLQGQLGLICLFHEALQHHQVKTLYESGPNCRLLFSPEDNAEMLVLNSKLVWCFAPAACWDGNCIDLAMTNKFTAQAIARQCHTHTIKDVINSIGGVQVLFLLLEYLDSQEGPDLSILSPQNSSPGHQDVAEWVVLPSSLLSEKKLEQNAVSSMLLVLRNMLISSSVNQEQLMKNNGVAILGTLLSKIPSHLMEPSVLKAIQLFTETVKSCGNVVLLRLVHQHILFNFSIWSRCPFLVRISHIQLMSTIIKDERKMFRKRYGVQFFLDAIRLHHTNSTEVSEEENKTIRVSLLGLVRFYLQKECNIKELAALLGFLSTVKEEVLVIEVLEMVITQLESRSCKDQLILLMFEPQSADLIYCLLLNKTFSMDLKHRALKLLSVLLRTEKVYERNKSRLRLQDNTPVGLYPGLISMLPEQQLSMEFTAMMLDQILLTESSSSYAGALSLLQALSYADLEIKIEAARKLLTTTFMRPAAPQSLAKQMGWQDCITRLLIKKPITDTNTEPFADLMSFEDDEELQELDPGRVSPSSASRISDAAYAIESEIKEVAETVTHAVADNIHYAADNISSAVASAYTVFRQKTVEMQESLEELGARSRLKKRSLTSLSECQEPDSPRPTRSPGPLSYPLDPDGISLSNRSQSSSSTEELSSPSHTSAKDNISLASVPSLSSHMPEDSDEDDEKILFDALQRWKAFDAEKLDDKEEELCYLISNLAFTIMWRGIDINSKDAWKERGQVMTCINLLALNNTLYCSHLELKLRLLEMSVTAALSDLREGSYTADNAAQLIRWIYDLTVIDPNQDQSKKASTKLLDGVLGLLDALLVFQEIPGEEWTEMAKLAFGILLSCAASSNLELCAMATAKLHTLIQTRCMKDAEEGGYLLFYINTIVQHTLQGGNQEHYSFLMPVVKALIEKLSDLLSIASYLPDLPQTLSGPTFYEHFQNFCQEDQWATFIDNQVKPLYESYQTGLRGQLTEAMNTFWAECYEGSKLCVHKRNREVGESKMRFQSQILAGYRARQTEEMIRYTNLCNQVKNQELLVRRKWTMLRGFFCGPRGAWRQRDEEEQHWKLSHHENFLRMRLKLCPNLHFTRHTDASNLRDNTGWLSRSRSEDVPLSLNISSAAVRGETEDADYIPEEDLRSLSEHELEGEAEAGKEKLVLSQECHLVTLMSAVKGRLDITTTHIYFHDLSPVRDDTDRQDFKWPLSSLREIYLRRYNLRRSALEIFLIDQTNYFLNFTTKTRNRVVSRLLGLRPPNLAYNSSRSPAELLRASGLTQKWVNHEITNFEYLMHLNTIAGRTYNDLSQYPVFPWIIADYSSEELDLTNPATFRNLSKPIGVVNPQNEADVRMKYESFEDPSGTIAKFHYGTHYSNSAGVLHYLVRVEPFTSLHIELQSGRFDVADRQFHSIPQTWKLLMDNPNDVKELIPEFFYFPEFFKNLNNFDLGLLQGTKERVNDVVLPKWADNAEDFIYKHRKALESEYVSAHLHEWIDLIFGYKQKGPKAVEALNVFYYCSYEGAVDLDAITNPVEREAVEGMINNFGQTPSQLLKEPHPQRLTLSDALAKMLKNDKKPDITMFLNKLSPVSVEVSCDKDPVVFISGPRSPPRGFLQAALPDSLVTISRSGVVGVHSWLPYDRHNNRGFTLDPDPTIANTKTRRSIAGSFHPSLNLHSQLFCLSHDGKMLISAGHWDCSVRVFSLTKNKTVCAVIRHFDLVTCIALDQCSWYLVSGSQDCTCVVWDVSQLNSAPLKPVHTLYGHDQPVTCVAIATELDLVASGSKDGTVNIHTIHEGQYMRSLYPAGCDLLATEITFLNIATQGHIAFTANSTTSHSVHVFSVNGESLGSKYVAGRVTGLTTAGDCLVVVDDAGDLTMSRLLGLYPVFDIPLHIPVQDVVVTPGNSHILVPLQDGNIIIICVSS